MFIENKFNVVIRSLFENANDKELHRNLVNELKLNEIQCDYIINNLPIVLYRNLDEKEVEVVKPRLDSLMRTGVNYEITKNNVDDISPMLWKSEEIVEANAHKSIEEIESEAMNETPEEIIINCPCASCGTVLQITKTDTGIEIKSISSATRNPLQHRADLIPERSYTFDELKSIVKAVEENVYGGIESLQDLPTKPDFDINFEDYGFKSVKDFMEYQNSLSTNKSLDAWAGGN